MVACADLDRVAVWRTAEDIQRVARATFRRGRTVVATLVEPSVEIDPEKEKLGLEAARKMVAALGGQEKVAAIRNVRIESDVSIVTPGGALAATSKTLYGVPDRMRSEFSLFGQSMVQAANATQCWRQQGGQVTDVEGEEEKETRADIERDMFLLAYPVSPNDYVLQGQGTEEGRHVVRVIGPSGRAFTTYIDAETGLPVRVTYEGKHPMTGKAAVFVEEFTDFRPVEGVRRPHRVVTTIDGKPFAEKTVTGLLINGEVAADEFVRPTG